MKTAIRTLSLLLFCLVLCLPAQGQKKQRIKQIWHHEPDVPQSFTYIDSIVYYYSGNRGSAFNPYSSFNWLYYGYRSDNLSSGTVYPAWDMPTPLADIWHMDVRPDSIFRTYHRKDDDTTNYALHTYVSYEQDTLMANFSSGTKAGQTSHQNIITYDEQGWPIQVYEMRLNNASLKMDTFINRRILYAPDKKVLADSIFGIVSHEDVYLNYTYDEDGRLKTFTQRKPSTAFGINFTIATYTYNAAGSVTEIWTQQFDEDVLIPLHKAILQYDADNRLINYSGYDEGGQLGYMRDVHYNGEGNPYVQDIKYYLNGNIFSCEWIEFYFNEYHNPDSAITWWDYCRSGFTNKRTTIYTYETYGEDTVAVKRKPFIYPNPARDVVNIRWNRNLRKTPVILRLYNATGMLVRNYSIAVPRTVDTISTEGLASGVYLLHICTGLKEELYTGKLVVR